MALLAITLAAAAPLGCSAERTQLRRHKDEVTILTEAAGGYWQAVRWGYLDKSSVFIEAGPNRLALLEYLQSRDGKASINDPKVYHVEVDEDLKTATVLVSYELLVPTDESVQERRVRERWYKKLGHWYLELTPEELKILE